MATMQHKIFCVREFIKTESATVQRGRAFVVGITNLSKYAVCVKEKSSGRPRVSEENMRRIQESFERSPRKSTRRASRELGIPQPTVWRVEAPFTVQAITPTIGAGSLCTSPSLPSQDHCCT